MKTVALVGARGHTGRELIRLLAERDDLRLELMQRRQAQFYRAYLSDVASNLTVDIDMAALQEATGT